jgi:hypothetical protein
MASFLLAWEYGGGLGHAARFKPLAAMLRARGHRVTLVLRDLVLTDSLLRDTDLPRLQAPLWQHRTMGLPDTQASIAEILLASGYLRSDTLSGQVQGWRTALALTQADVLVADYAPTAVLAARIEGVPSAVVGIGFYMPPERSPMPAFRDWEPLAPGRIEHAERTALAAANGVLQAAGAQPLAQLSQLLHGDDSLLCTWPELDHYGRDTLPPGRQFHGVDFLPQSGTAPQWPEGSGPEVFAYLKSAHPDHVAVLQALVDAGCRVLCYMPELAGGKAVPVASARIRYSAQPVDLGTACARSALVVCHAGIATLTQALLAGKPVLLLPMQAEQFLLSRRVGRIGAGINVAEHRRPVDLLPLVRQLLAPGAACTAAAAFADRYRNFDRAVQLGGLVDRFEALLDRA